MDEELFDEEGFRYKLDNFEGPLDLLLEIIKKNKLDIETVKLADITEQYLEFMSQCDTLDMEKASQFITMAATLIEIKSRTVLPRFEESEDDEEDEEARILQKMKEYAILKEASQDLQKYEDINRMYKQPDDSVGDAKIVLKDMVLDKLLDAFVHLMTKVDKKDIIEEPKKISKDRFTVADKIASIKALLETKDEIGFSELFEEGQTKSELINIFLAVLELLKRQVIKVSQNELFGEIKINLNKEKN